MTEHPLTPQLADAAPAAAVQSLQVQEAGLIAPRITALPEAVRRATEVWQRGEPLCAAREQECRSHVVKLEVTLRRRRADTGGRVRPLARRRRSRALLTRLVPPLGFARSHAVRPAVFAKVLDAQALFRCFYDTSRD